jgi:3',5'-cyclic AMP phosphodiesterase CpdA
MNGEFYYSFKPAGHDVRFIALESTYMEPDQLRWLENTLERSREEWKIVFFHHPLYSSAGTHGSDERLRRVLEPLFVKHNVSVVLTGHDHVYERTKPQQGITYFVAGSGGKLRPGDARKTAFSARTVDNINVFLVLEIRGDELVFNAVGANGRVVDSGRIGRVGSKAEGTRLVE